MILEFEKVFDDENKDTKLTQKLTTPEELSGLLNLALVALRKLRHDNGFKDIPVEEIRKKYEERSNTVKAFIDSKCTINISDQLCDVLTSDMYAAYCKFCTEERKERPLDLSVLGKRLKEIGIEKKTVQRNGYKSSYYIGVRLNSNCDTAGAQPRPMQPRVLRCHICNGSGSDEVFQTHDESELRQHMGLQHPNKPVIIPVDVEREDVLGEEH